MNTKRWAYAAVSGWTMTVAGAGLCFGLAFSEGWAWSVATVLVLVTVLVAIIAMLAVWALVGEEG